MDTKELTWEDHFLMCTMNPTAMKKSGWYSMYVSWWFTWHLYVMSDAE